MTGDTTSQSLAEQQILRELKKMSKILTLANAPALERELNKYATSNDRKRIWISIDGKRKPAEIAKELGLSIRTVEIFVKVLGQVELIESRSYGEPPRKAIDFVPASWMELVESKAVDNQVQTPLPVPDSQPEPSKESRDEVKTIG